MEFPDGEPIDYSIDCPCLEPLEFLGLLLPAIEEKLGEIKGVFVEETVEEKSSPLGTTQEYTPRKMRKTFYWLISKFKR